MEKKYQVFVSSTYEDLQEERKKVMEALLQMNCFPVGMEYFNASDSSQWEVIKSLISECDYYVLIVAGRYGSIEKESGKSYTQKEFEYAIEQGIPVISFVHQDSNTLPGSKLESEPDKKMKLEEFKSDVQKRLCKFWGNADGLASQVVLSLNSLIKTAPRIGWVKADEISSADANKEILALKKDNEELQRQLNELNVGEVLPTDELQQGKDLFKIRAILNYYSNEEDIYKEMNRDISWDDLFYIIGPIMYEQTDESKLCSELEDFFKRMFCKELLLTSEEMANASVELVNEDFQTIKLQLLVLGLIKSEMSGKWLLTQKGRTQILYKRALKK